MPLHFKIFVFLHVVCSSLPSHAVNTKSSALDEAPLLDQLLEQLGTGTGRCTKVTKLARAALKAQKQGLHSVAKIRPGSHAERDLQSWISRQVWRKLLQNPYKFDLIVGNSGKDKVDVTMEDHFALLPPRSVRKYVRARSRLIS